MDPIAIGTGASTAAAWLWSQFGKDFLGKMSATTKDKWNAFREQQHWHEAAEQYRLSLQRQYGTIRLFGKSQPVPLEGIFTNVYILDEIMARRRFDIEVLKQKQSQLLDREQNIRRYSGMELVKQGGNLFILGKPGAGKTTF